jgi:hypothetical protein
MYIPADN